MGRLLLGRHLLRSAREVPLCELSLDGGPKQVKLAGGALRLIERGDLQHAVRVRVRVGLG